MGRNSVKVLIVLLILTIIAAGGILAYKIYKDKNQPVVSEEEPEAQVEEKTVQIFKGNDRPLAVMIDNHKDAWPQANLESAYMVYEIVVEGGETRLMALYKGVDVDKIGPVRSARHYFIDYAMENDAIYVHFGQSPQAESDIKKFSINDINGIAEDGVTFWRVKDKASPHNAVTSTEKLLQSAKNKNYRVTSSETSVLNYVTDEVNLDGENSQPATLIRIPHSNLQMVSYEYNPETKRYSRYARRLAQTDWETGAQITTKNIIIEKCNNYTLQDKENKGRQGLNNIGTFDGYYITNGRAIPIQCIKEERNKKTVYKDLAGNVINVNDGNTFVQICPVDAQLTIEGTEETPSAEATPAQTANT